MGPDRRTLIGAGLLAGAVAASGAKAADWPADPAEVIPLWPKGPPGAGKVTVTQTVVERPIVNGLRDRAITGVTKPTMSVFRPAKPNGAAVILIPGGSYLRVVVDKEGFETARWLADKGYTCFVLLYRLPGDGWAAGPDAPLQDAQRAIRLVRQMGFAKIAVQGFSAGGNVAARAITRFDKKTYEPVDAADALSARPDLGALMYAVISMDPTLSHAESRQQMLGDNPTPAGVAAFSAQTNLPANTPPTILIHAADDPTVAVENSLVMFQALKAAKIPAELHVFEEGGHGFGLRFVAGKPVAVWPELFTAFSKRHGL